MARHRQPEALARLKGAHRKDPAHYRTRTPRCTLPLGSAPAHLAPATVAAWGELERYSLVGVLTGADRVVLEVTASLLALFRANPTGFQSAKLRHLIGCLARLGLTPSDGQKLGVRPPPGCNPFAEF